MEPDLLGLNEVVVTALGITREKKSLGYSVQEVGGDNISKTKESNFVNSLSGKYPVFRLLNQIPWVDLQTFLSEDTNH